MRKLKLKKVPWPAATYVKNTHITKVYTVGLLQSKMQLHFGCVLCPSFGGCYQNDEICWHTFLELFMKCFSLKISLVIVDFGV